jgi:hypothetical protein
VFPLLPLVLGGALQRHRAAPLAMGAGMASTFALVGVLVAGSVVRSGSIRTRCAAPAPSCCWRSAS